MGCVQVMDFWEVDGAWWLGSAIRWLVAGWWVLAGGWWLLGQLALCKEARSGAKTPLLPPEQGR